MVRMMGTTQGRRQQIAHTGNTEKVATVAIMAIMATMAIRAITATNYDKAAVDLPPRATYRMTP